MVVKVVFIIQSWIFDFSLACVIYDGFDLCREDRGVNVTISMKNDHSSWHPC